MSDPKHIKDLKPDKKNARKHNPRNIGMIEKSLQEVGAARSIVIDEEGNILAGNGTVEAAGNAGITKVKVVDADGETIVAVRRKGLTAKQKKRLAVADNRTAELAEWDVGVLAELAEEDVLDGLFSENELDDLLEELKPKAGKIDDDEVPEDAPARVKRGQIWKLGKHRVMCGDSTDEADVALLMDGVKADMVFTDPPYGVDYEGGSKRRKKLKDDHIGTNIYEKAVPILSANCDGPCYVWYAGTKPIGLYDAVAKVGEIHALIIWVKNNATFNMNIQYKQRHEPCLYWKPKGSTLRWCGPTNEETVWEVDRELRNEHHPTQKPVMLAERAVKNHKAETILDLFLGSGSTLIACEKLGRKCYGMEIDPHYCDVIIERWEQFTGKNAEPIHA